MNKANTGDSRNHMVLCDTLALSNIYTIMHRSALLHLQPKNWDVFLE